MLFRKPSLQPGFVLNYCCQSPVPTLGFSTVNLRVWMKTIKRMGARIMPGYPSLRLEIPGCLLPPRILLISRSVPVTLRLLWFLSCLLPWSTGVLPDFQLPDLMTQAGGREERSAAPGLLPFVTIVVITVVKLFLYDRHITLYKFKVCCVLISHTYTLQYGWHCSNS